MLRRALLAVLLVTGSVRAQLVESIEVRVTNIDVVVTDRAGNPVTGLTKDDFVVVENGKEQPVTNFYEIREATATATPTPDRGGADAPSPTVPESIAKRRIVVFVDNYTIHPLARNRAFAALEKSMDEIIRDGDEAMIAFWDRRLRIIAPFTADRAALVARFKQAAKESSGGMSLDASRSRIISHAIQMIADSRAKGRGPSIRQSYETSLFEATAFAEEMFALQEEILDDLERVIGTLAGVEGKKALIFLGAELPQDPALDLFQQLDAMYGPYMSRGIEKPAVIREGGKRSLGANMREVAQEANANGVTMYMVDTADRDLRGDPTQGLIDPQALFMSQTNTPIAMGMVASITGGVAVTGAKSFEAALDTIVRDLSSYYSIGYRSPDGGQTSRDVKVRVRRDGLRVRSRSTYIVRTAEENVRDRVFANVFHANVSRDFEIDVTLGTPERQPNGQFRLPLTITFPSSMTLIPRDGQLEGEFAVYIATGTEEGVVSEVSRNVQPLKFPADSQAQLHAMGTFEYKASLLVRQGEQFVSVAVVDTLAGTAGFAREKVVAR